MDDELRKKRLETIATKRWKTTLRGAPVVLQGAEVVTFYEAIRDRKLEPYTVLGCEAMSQRKVDSALQALKRAGLIVFDKKSRAWRAT